MGDLDISRSEANKVLCTKVPTGQTVLDDSSTGRGWWGGNLYHYESIRVQALCFAHCSTSARAVFRYYVGALQTQHKDLIMMANLAGKAFALVAKLCIPVVKQRC